MDFLWQQELRAQPHSLRGVSAAPGKKRKCEAFLRGMRISPEVFSLSSQSLVPSPGASTLHCG